MDKVSPGTPLGKSPLRRAAFVNDVVDTVGDYKRRAMGNSADGKFTPLSTDCVKIKNNTGDDLLEGDVVQLGNRLLTSVNKRFPWFEADYPTPPLHYARYAVLREPVKNNQIGWAQVAGECVALLNVGNFNHTHAIPSPAGEIGLVTDFIGPIEILHALAEADEDEKVTAFVRLAVPPPELLLKFDAEVAKGESGTAKLYTGSLDGPPTDSGFEVEDVFSFFTTCPADTWAECNLLNGNKSVHVLECDGGGGGEDGLPDPDSESMSDES